MVDISNPTMRTGLVWQFGPRKKKNNFAKPRTGSKCEVLKSSPVRGFEMTSHTNKSPVRLTNFDPVPGNGRESCEKVLANNIFCV